MNNKLSLIPSLFILVIFSLPMSTSTAEQDDDSNRVEVHDYVIIGGGTAGLTLGYLLNKDGHDVVVLEAGPDRDNDPNIRNPKPIGALESGWRNEYFWTTNGKPQNNLPNDDAHYSGGRVLGGSSTINDSIYWRGMQRTYDKWGGLFADAEYVRNVFVVSETYNGVTQDQKARGTTGPFHVTQAISTPIGNKWVSAMHKVLLDSYNLDVPVVPDVNTVNGPALSSRAQFYLDPVDFTRVSTSSILLKKWNSSLDVRTLATVTKILFKKRKAYGVKYVHNGISKLMRARKKVILCAGIRSAKLLQLSGIGEKTELQAAGVKVVYNNPHVGKNLVNHILLTMVASANPSDNQVIAGNLAFKQLSGLGAIPDPNAADRLDRHLEFGVINPAPGIIAFAVILNKPESTGYQKIVNKDPLAPMVVDFGYLTQSIDRDRLVTGLEIMRKTVEKIAETDPNYKIISDISNPTDYVVKNASHIHHWSGTSAIGSVVDKHLGVIGVKNLMVADVSVSPTTVRGHTHAAAILIGAVAYSEITGNKAISFEY